MKHLSQLLVPAAAPAGFVYAMSYPDDRHHIKIGFTNNPTQRVRDIGGTLAPKNPQIEALYFAPEAPQRIERAVHRRLGECRVNGEWFRVGAADAADAIERAAGAMGLFVVEVDTEPCLW